MTGKDLDGLNFTELVFLENHLREVVLPIVKKVKRLNVFQIMDSPSIFCF